MLPINNNSDSKKPKKCRRKCSRPQSTTIELFGKNHLQYQCPSRAHNVLVLLCKKNVNNTEFYNIRLFFDVRQITPVMRLIAPWSFTQTHNNIKVDMTQKETIIKSKLMYCINMTFNKLLFSSFSSFVPNFKSLSSAIFWQEQSWRVCVTHLKKLFHDILCCPFIWNIATVLLLMITEILELYLLTAVT